MPDVYKRQIINCMTHTKYVSRCKLEFKQGIIIEHRPTLTYSMVQIQHQTVEAASVKMRKINIKNIPTIYTKKYQYKKSDKKIQNVIRHNQKNVIKNK